MLNTTDRINHLHLQILDNVLRQCSCRRDFDKLTDDKAEANALINRSIDSRLFIFTIEQAINSENFLLISSLPELLNKLKSSIFFSVFIAGQQGNLQPTNKLSPFLHYLVYKPFQRTFHY